MIMYGMGHVQGHMHHQIMCIHLEAMQHFCQFSVQCCFILFKSGYSLIIKTGNRKSIPAGHLVRVTFPLLTGKNFSYTLAIKQTWQTSCPSNQFSMHQKLNVCTCYNVKMKVGTHKNINSLSKQHIRRHHFDFFSFVLCYQKQKTWDGSLTRTRCHQSYLTLSSLLDSCKKKILTCDCSVGCANNCYIVLEPADANQTALLLTLTTKKH